MVSHFNVKRPGDLDTDDLFRFRPELGHKACMLRTRLALIVYLVETKRVPIHLVWKHLDVKRTAVYRWLREFNDMGVDTQSLGFRLTNYRKRNRNAPIILTEDPNGKQIEEYRRPSDTVDAEETDADGT
jgi:hypothetical protein